MALPVAEPGPSFFSSFLGADLALAFAFAVGSAVEDFALGTSHGKRYAMRQTARLWRHPKKWLHQNKMAKKTTRHPSRGKLAMPLARAKSFLFCPLFLDPSNFLWCHPRFDEQLGFLLWWLLSGKHPVGINNQTGDIS